MRRKVVICFKNTHLTIVISKPAIIIIHTVKSVKSVSKQSMYKNKFLVSKTGTAIVQISKQNHLYQSYISTYTMCMYSNDMVSY